MSYTARKDKRRKRRLLKPILLLMLILAIIGTGMKFGIIPGGEKIFGANGVLPNNNTATDEPAKTYDIVVSETTITLDGQSVTLDELQATFEKATAKDTYQIKDNQAIKETFERVIELAKTNNVTYKLVE